MHPKIRIGLTIGAWLFLMFVFEFIFTLIANPYIRIIGPIGEFVNDAYIYPWWYFPLQFFGIPILCFGIAGIVYNALGRRQRRKTEITGYNQFAAIGRAIEVRHGRSEEETGNEIRMESLSHPHVIPLQEYLRDKASNRNIAVIGMPGSGKTQLLYYLIGAMPYKKIIFTYKNDDRYTELGIPTLHLKNYSPNVFLDKEGFVDAWNTAFLVQAQGIIAGEVEPYIRKILKKANTWQEFEEGVEQEIKMARMEQDMISGRALKDIELKAMSVSKEKQFNIDLPEQIVVSFEGLSEREFVFYGEYLLFQLFEQIKSGKRRGTVLFIDESQLFLKTGRSIMSSLAALIRATGAFIFSTQLLLTIAGPIKGSAATQFCFKQTEYEDLRAAGAFGPIHQWIIQRLPPFTFVDLAQAESHLGLYVFQIINPSPIFMPIVEWKPAPELENPENSKQLQEGDLKEEVYAIISEDLPRSIYGIAGELARRQGGDRNSYQLTLLPKNKNSPINSLLTEKRISSFKFEPVEGNEVTLYYKFGSYAAHDYLVKLCRGIFQESEVSIPGQEPEIQEHGTANPDILWNSKDVKYAIEIEMDTKGSTGVSETELRLRKFQKDGYEIMMIAPNEAAVKHLENTYKDLNISVLTTIKGLVEMFPGKEAEAPGKGEEGEEI